MRVALLHYAAPPVVGGVESVLAQHARLLAAGGHQVSVVAGRGEQWAPAIPLAVLPLADSRHPRVLALKAELDAGRCPAGFGPLVLELEAELQSTLAGVDVVLAHNVGSLHKNLALTAALYQLSQAQAFRLVLWHHDPAWAAPHYQAELHAGYPWNLLRQAWPGVRQVTISHRRQRELAGLMGLAPEAIRVVSNGIDRGEFLSLSPAVRHLAAQLGLGQANPLLLLPVRLTPRKNVELALRVLAALQPTYPQAALVVTGPPGPHNPANAEYLAGLRRLRAELGLERAAHFLTEVAPGRLPDSAIGELYRLADALFLPSREEGFGLPLLESALSRLPVFCAQVPPLPEVGGAEATYFALDAAPGDIAALVAAGLQADGAYRFAARVRARYDWDRIYREGIEPLLQP